MTTYKDTVEIERSLDFITSIIKETFMIGSMQFFVRVYVLEEDDDVVNFFGCFTLNSKISPAFDSHTECLRHAMKLYNENLDRQDLYAKNHLGDSIKDSK
jgi:hypothetical protein